MKRQTTDRVIFSADESEVQFNVEKDEVKENCLFEKKRGMIEKNKGCNIAFYSSASSSSSFSSTAYSISSSSSSSSSSSLTSTAPVFSSSPPPPYCSSHSSSSSVQGSPPSSISSLFCCSSSPMSLRSFLTPLFVFSFIAVTMVLISLGRMTQEYRSDFVNSRANNVNGILEEGVSEDIFNKQHYVEEEDDLGQLPFS